LIQVIYKEILKVFYIDKIQVLVYIRWVQLEIVIKMIAHYKILVFHIHKVQNNKLQNKLIFIIMQVGKQENAKISILQSNTIIKLSNAILIISKHISTVVSRTIELAI
jgi:hypothetical protein